jgi:membrane-associated phospholipid phosphatase
VKSSKNTLRNTLFIVGILLISGLIFASLAEDVVDHETMSTLDPFLGNWLLSKTTPTGSQVFSLITFLGSSLGISGGTAIIGLWLIKRKRWNQLVLLFMSVGGASLLNLALKNAFQRARPDYYRPFIDAAGFSFPSGHTMISTAFFGIIAYLVFITFRDQKFRNPVIIGCFVLSALIGFSRLYLGVHYLTDVLAGWAGGLAWLIVCILCSRLYDHKKRAGQSPATVG